MADKKYKTISQKQLVRMFKDHMEYKTESNHFCFLLGAGASKSSGIPTGWELSKQWFEELKEDLGERDWMKDISNQNVGEHYSDLYEKRYGNNPALGFEKFKTLMEGKEPKLAYAILAQILADGKHHFVITTNFDYMIEDAIRIYTDKKPFIAGHETLAGFISLQTQQPTVIKVHRDLYLHPFNTDKETDDLKDEWKKALSPLLKQFHLLVIGYGGNDGSLMNYLKEVDDRLPIYWCLRKGEQPNIKIKELLTETDFVIEINSFDELMYALHEALNLDLFKDPDKPDEHRFVKAAKERLKKLDNERTELATSFLKEEKDKDMDAALKSILSGGVSKILYEAGREKDNKKKKNIYQKGLEVYPKNLDLLSCFAEFLFDTGDVEAGNEQFENLITLNQDKYRIYFDWGYYSGELAKTKTGDEADKLYKQAFEKYKKAINFKPDYHEAYYNWGTFLGNFAKTKTGDEAEKLYEQAFEKFEKAISLKSDKYETYGNWGVYLGKLAETKTGDEADKLYKQAFEKFENAINIKPDYHVAYSNWGTFLGELAETKTGDEADKLYKQAFEKYEKAINIKPDFHVAYSNWGNVLVKLAKTKTGNEVEKLYKQAFEKYEKAINFKPDYYEAYYNWKMYLEKLAETKTGYEAEKLHHKADLISKHLKNLKKQ